MSMADRWEALQEELRALDASERPSADPEVQRRVGAAVSALRELQAAVASAGTFSRNDELDDVHTHDLKYLLVPFLLSDLLSKMIDDDRLEHLKEACGLLSGFLAKTRTLGVLSEREAERLLEAAPRDRQGRIERLKRDRELGAKLAALEPLRQRARVARAEDPNSEGRWDDLERRYQLLSLERAMGQAVDRLALTRQEVELLSLSQPEKAAACAARDRAQAEARAAPADPIRLGPSVPTERQRILADVFRVTNAPTLTLDQYMAAHPEEFTPAPAAPQSVAGASEKAEEEEEDAAVAKARAWDDWKDDHPRGWGNRKANVG